MLVFRVCWVRQNLYVYSLYRNPDLDDRIFDCLPSSMAVMQAADTHLKLLDRAVSGAWFLTGGVVECYIAHYRSVAVLCMLYKIRSNPVHTLKWCSTWTICVSAGYRWISGRT